MKKKAEGMSLRETFAIHRRAARDMRRIAPGCFMPFILCAVVEAASPYAVIWLSARLVDELSTLRRPEILAKWVLWIVAVSAAAELLKAVLERWKNVRSELLDRQKEVLYTEKFLRMDYADCDRQETRDLFSQIRQNADWSGWGFAHLKLYYTQAVQGITGILGAAALTVSLFTRQVPTSAGKLTALNHPLFLVGILLLIAAVTCLGPALVGRAYSAWNTLAEQVCFGNRVFSHFVFMQPGDKEKDMDRRMYRQNELAEHYVRTVNIFGVGSPVAKASQTTVGLSKALAASLSAVLSGVVYVFVCLKALGGAFGIGSVTQYVSAVTTFSGNAALLLSTVSHMRANAEFLKAIYTFLDIPNSMYQGSLTTEKRSDRQYDVEFRDVSFRYPGSDIWALRHVNMRFKVGKRLAIVGENGSGKTTFIKLLCRLYDPQEGQILLNGIDIRKYRYDDYMGIFSVVFQDFQLICQPLGNNVAGSMEYDRDRAKKALIDAGFADRLAAMEKGLDNNIPKMQRDLARYGITYDQWFFESSLHESGYVADSVQALTDLGYTYEKDGALWLNTSRILAENLEKAGKSDADIEKLGLKDDVLRRANGFYTYFAADIAYHRNKFAVRGFDKVINVWGADHHGHVARLKGAMDALGLDGEHRLDIVLMQLVKLVRDGEVVRMSKRTGKAISLTDLLDEIPVDACRYFFNAKPETQMEFDLGLAVREDSENPVYYVQYAHARICTLLKALEAEGYTVPAAGEVDFSLLSGEAEQALIKKIAAYSQVVRLAARDYDPSHINRYLTELAGDFHRFYTACRIKGEERPVLLARLKLADTARSVLKNAMTLIGCTAPEKM